MDSLKITGAWTKAGIASCIKVQGATKHDSFLLDCGVLDSETLDAKFILITHGHVDHVGSCISHARAKALSSGPSSYYVPKDIVSSLSEAKSAFEKMDGTNIPMNIVGVSAGDSFLVGSNLKVVVFPTVHRVPSQGYAIYTVKKGELLPEYHNMPKEEIAQHKRAGCKIVSDNTEELQLVYTGDTTFEGLIQPSNSFIFTAPIFITELTYLDGEYAKANQWGHIHIQDIIDNEELFQTEGQTIFFVHLSQKYSLSRALKLLREQIPSSMFSRVKVSLKSFGANEHMTRIDDSRWSQRENHQAGWGWASNNSVAFNHHSYNNRISSSVSDGGRTRSHMNLSTSFSVSARVSNNKGPHRKLRPNTAGKTTNNNIATESRVSSSDIQQQSQSYPHGYKRRK